MKFFRSLIVASILALLTTYSYAQECAPTAEDQAKEKRNEWIQKEKIAFFTSEIDLTPEEAQLFWPLYNKCWKESTAAHQKTMKALWAIKKAKDTNISSEEMEKLVAAYIKAQNSEKSSFTRYYAEFKKILPIEKVGRIYVAEELFKRKMIHNLRKAPGSSSEAANQAVK